MPVSWLSCLYSLLWFSDDFLGKPERYLFSCSKAVFV